MKRITQEETHYYIKLDKPDPYKMRKAVAYTLTPSIDPEFEGWEDVTYYTDLENQENSVLTYQDGKN